MTRLPMLATTCAGCGLLTECGGQRGQQTLGGCLGGCGSSCGGPGKCDWVCPAKPDFIDRVREVSGLTTRSAALMPSSELLALGSYVPIIRHASSRTAPVSAATVALPLEEVVKWRGQSYGVAAGSAVELRAQFGVRDDVSVVLVSVARDRVLERYWACRRKWFIPRQLKELGFTAVTVPNFSAFLDAPRPHTLWNRRRMEIVAAEFAELGLVVIPHLNSLQMDDWLYWQAFLAEQKHLTHVATEFQTGLRVRDRGEPAVVDLARLQDRLGRQLHPVIVGGAAYAADLGRYFADLTFVDSQPFMKAMHRRRGVGQGKWERAEAIDVGELLEANIRAHEAHILSEISRGRAGVPPRQHRRALPTKHASTFSKQLPFPPSMPRR
jgi:hypothetical protein